MEMERVRKSEMMYRNSKIVWYPNIQGQHIDVTPVLSQNKNIFPEHLNRACELKLLDACSLTHTPLAEKQE